MKLRVSRDGKHFTEAEYLKIAGILSEMYRLEQDLFRMVNGRVLVKWLDALCGFNGKKPAMRYFGNLRSALDDDYLDATGKPVTESPFYGEKFRSLREGGADP